MSDDLPRLTPGDPENHLSKEARKRILRAMIEADKFRWEAEVLIKDRRLDENSAETASIRKKASFDKARAVLSVYRTEFSRINISEQQYRQYMKEEITSAAASLLLHDVEQRLFEVEFYFPEEQPARPKPSTARAAPPLKEIETIASQISRLRKECQLSVDALAELMSLDVRSVRRHLAGDSVPYDRHLWAYQRVFSKLLNREVVIRKMS